MYHKQMKSTRTFLTEKKNQLEKKDKSKKGSVDERIRSLLALLNAHPEHYTTSSCSGRIILWRGSGKKNETEWLKVSHEPIDARFLTVPDVPGLVWLRLEPVILHVACADIRAAALLVDAAKKVCKKSTILSITNKIIVEIRGSEFLEMPLVNNGQLLYQGEIDVLVEIVNEKMGKIKEKVKTLERVISREL